MLFSGRGPGFAPEEVTAENDDGEPSVAVGPVADAAPEITMGALQFGQLAVRPAK
ncbi:MAG: hypothetical protein ACR2NZ_10975 [Rubripirellula sp.]